MKKLLIAHLPNGPVIIKLKISVLLFVFCLFFVCYLFFVCKKQQQQKKTEILIIRGKTKPSAIWKSS